MTQSMSSHLLTDQDLRAALATRDVGVPAAGQVPGTNLPLVEPIWAFWMDAAHLANLTTALAARQVGPRSGESSRRIPRIVVPPQLTASLEAWFTAHRDGSRRAEREANYLSHYGLRLTSTGSHGGTNSSRFLEVFHAALVEATRPDGVPGASALSFMLRRAHVHLSWTASPIVEGAPHHQLFTRLGESMSLGRSDLLTAQQLLASPEIAAALRGHILVGYPEGWMPVLDRLRRLTRDVDSLSLFYHDLAVTSEALVLSIRLGDWMHASSEDAARWATFWRRDILRYLVAYQEVTGRAAD